MITGEANIDTTSLELSIPQQQMLVGKSNEYTDRNNKANIIALGLSAAILPYKEPIPPSITSRLEDMANTSYALISPNSSKITVNEKVHGDKKELRLVVNRSMIGKSPVPTAYALKADGSVENVLPKARILFIQNWLCILYNRLAGGKTKSEQRYPSYSQLYLAPKDTRLLFVALSSGGIPVDAFSNPTNLSLMDKALTKVNGKNPTTESLRGIARNIYGLSADRQKVKGAIAAIII